MQRYQQDGEKPSYATASNNNYAPQPKMTFGKANQTDEKVQFDNRYFAGKGMNINRGMPHEN